MKSRFISTLILWGLSIVSGITSALLEGNSIFELIVLLCAGFLSIFYFYGSVIYFMELPIKLILRPFDTIKSGINIISFFLGIPFALCSISLIFLVLEFPGGAIVFALSIIFWFIIFTFMKFGVRIEPSRLKFINKNYMIFIIICIFVFFILILKWPSSAIEMKWVEPTTIPGM